MAGYMDSCFPQAALPFVRKRLGLFPRFGELADAWRLFGLPPGKLARGLLVGKVRDLNVVYVFVGGSADSSTCEVVVPFVEAADRVDWFASSVLAAPLMAPAAVGGWCHRRLETGSPVGAPWPTVSQLVEAGKSVAELDDSLVRLGDGECHVAPGEGTRDWVPTDVVGAVLESRVSVFQQLSELPDYSVCKCRVHIAPRPLPDGGAGGCSLRAVGSHPVVRAAAQGVHRFCHAEPGVRERDRQFLELLSREPVIASFRLFGSRLTSEEFSSEVSTPVGFFGRGYCYLEPIYGDLRWRVARLLGPNPLGSDVMRVWQWAMMPCFKRKLLQEVAPGWWHVSSDPGACGADDRAGGLLYEALEAAVAKVPGLRLGANPSAPAGSSAGGLTHPVGLATVLVQAGCPELDGEGHRLLALAVTPASRLEAEEKRQKRMLEAVGDAVLTLALARSEFQAGQSVQHYQEARARLTSNACLMNWFMRSEVSVDLTWSAVELSSVTAAKAVECMFGAAMQLGGYSVAEALASRYLNDLRGDASVNLPAG